MKPEKPTLQECLDAPAYSAVTSSPCSIESPQTQNLYITPRSEKPQKEHSEAYYKKQVELFAGIDPRLTFFDAVVIAQLVSWVRQKDGFMICGAEKLGNYFGQSKQSALLSLLRLEKFGYLHCFQRGKGRGVASKYQLGELYSKEKRNWVMEQLLANEEKAKPLNFERTEPKGKPRGKPPTKGEKVQNSIPFNNAEKVQKSISKRYKNLYPHPIGQPIDTHTKELPSAFTKENWLKECLKLNPNRDLKDIDRTFEKARDQKGAKDSDWLRWAKHFDSYYEPTTKASPAPAPRSWQRQPSKPQESACYSPPLPPLDYTDPIVLRDEIYFALRDRNGIAGIVGSAKGQGVTSDLVDVALAHADTRLKDYYASKNNKLSTFDSLKFEGGSKIKI